MLSHHPFTLPPALPPSSKAQDLHTTPPHATAHCFAPRNGAIMHPPTRHLFLPLPPREPSLLQNHFRFHITQKPGPLAMAPW